MPEIVETRKYIIVRIPKERGGDFRSRRSAKADFREIEGVLKKDARFQGKTSVEVQHRAFEL